MKYFDEEDAITEYEKQLQKKDNEIERLKEQLSDEIDDELKQSEIMVKQQQEIEKLTFESTKWESKFYDEAKKVDRTIEYIENEMPCLWEVDDVWEDINGNYQHNYKEYDTQILLNKLKGVDKE